MMEKELSANSFQPLKRDSSQLNQMIRPCVSFWKDAWSRLWKNKMGMFGLCIVLFMIAFGIFVPLLSDVSYSDQDLTKAFLSPNSEYWFGSDNLGRDVFVRIAYGARISLSVGIAASLVSLTIGVIFGTISGFYGGRVDNIMMRIVDIINSVPSMLYVILLMTVLKRGLVNVFIVIGATSWLSMARLVRGEVLSLKEREFILAARVSGVSTWQVMLHHLIPNAMGPIIVSMTMGIPAAIFLESNLSFLGLGISAPMASWGSMASEGIEALKSSPHLIFFPALFISLTILGFNFLGDALRDALDPRMRK